MKEDNQIIFTKDEKDIIEEMTILELNLTNKIKEIKNSLDEDIEDIINETEMNIINDIKGSNNIHAGVLIKKGKLYEKHIELRNILSSMNKKEAKIYDLSFELLEDLNLEIEKNPKK